MNKDNVLKLKNGIYKITWNDGSSSLSAVGTDRNGGKWIAPINWTQPGCSKRKNWVDVNRVKLLLDENSDISKLKPNPD